MMIKPGISELSKCVDSRYTLVTMAAKRARMIGEERMHDMDAYGDEKPVSVAAEEIVEGSGLCSFRSNQACKGLGGRKGCGYSFSKQ